MMRYREAVQWLAIGGYRYVCSKKMGRLPISVFLTELTEHGLGEYEVNVKTVGQGKAIVRPVKPNGFPDQENPYCTVYTEAAWGNRPLRETLNKEDKAPAPERPEPPKEPTPLIDGQKPEEILAKVDWESFGLPVSPGSRRSITLGQKLEAALDHLGISLQEFADRAGVNVGVIGRLYRGKSKRPRSNRLKKRVEEALARVCIEKEEYNAKFP
ncbi:MAG: helix-turn-helix transcriptional regulator [Candidatus Bipolaricaulota bacterium]|nr:helix-turn-helix transcriptional regulator [Candidatus Bipolaricaulota bacterium]